MDVPHSPGFIVLCGKTGSGKTALLRQLKLSGYPTIDLEKIASHRGSAFGSLLLNVQPSQPDFDTEIQKSFLKHCSAYIFVEQKPTSLGKRKIPAWFYTKIQHGIFVMLDVDKKRRIDNILREYRAAGKESFMHALLKLKERLPDSVMKECKALLHSENYNSFIENMLDYYDQTSKYNVEDIKLRIKVETNNSLETMNILLKKLVETGINVL